MAPIDLRNLVYDTTDRKSLQVLLTNSTDDAGETLREGAGVNVKGTHVIHTCVRIGRLQLHWSNTRHLQQKTESHIIH